MVKAQDIRLFCESFNIDNYEWKVYDLSDIGRMINVNDLLANNISEEQIRNGIELCLYDYSDLLDDLDEKTTDIIKCIEDKIFDWNESKIPLVYIEGRCSEICSYIDSAFAEKYISDLENALLVYGDGSCIDYSVDLISNFHTRDEFNATLYWFYKNILSKKLEELKEQYKIQESSGNESQQADGEISPTNKENNNSNDKANLSKISKVGEVESGNESTANDILLRGIFGSHLCAFLSDALKLKKGSLVARLVNWYVREYKLEESIQLNKPLKEALTEKGIETASKATWNNIIRNK